MSLPSPPFDVALIGAGSVGTGVAALLLERGHHVIGVASRTESSTARAGIRLRADRFEIDRPVAADVFLLGAPAGAAAEISRLLSQRIDLSGRVLIHFSGAHGVEAFQGVEALGGHVCALHPVQACPDVDAAIHNLPGSAWGVTTTAGSEAWAEDFVRGLDGYPVRVREERRVAWHAASVITSNGIAALLAGGEQTLRSIGVVRPEEVLGPLASGTVNNARTGGGGGLTLTGPVVRKEFDVVSMHVAALRRIDPEMAERYRMVSELIGGAAVEADRFEEADLQQLRDVLRRS